MEKAQDQSHKVEGRRVSFKRMGADGNYGELLTGTVLRFDNQGFVIEGDDGRVHVPNLSTITFLDKQ